MGTQLIFLLKKKKKRKVKQNSVPMKFISCYINSALKD